MNQNRALHCAIRDVERGQRWFIRKCFMMSRTWNLRASSFERWTRFEEKMTFAEKKILRSMKMKSFWVAIIRSVTLKRKKVGGKRFKRMNEFEFGAENFKILTAVDFKEDKVTISQLVVKTDHRQHKFVRRGCLFWTDFLMN